MNSVNIKVWRKYLKWMKFCFQNFFRKWLWLLVNFKLKVHKIHKSLLQEFLSALGVVKLKNKEERPEIQDFLGTYQ